MPQFGIPGDLVRYNNRISAVPNLWHLPKATWEPIWKIYGGDEVKVAVLDTGYSRHPDLPEPIEAESFVRGEQVEDGNGHGSHCCGTAVGRNGLGVAPRAKLLVGKVLSNSGSGGSDGIAQGIRWAVDQGAHIISMSLGGGSSYGPTNEAIKYAWSKGCITNAAAGNAGYNGRNTVGWPAKFSECMCTGAIGPGGSIANFSSGGVELDYATPGVDIISCRAGSSDYTSMSGTSMSTPFMSGLLALILQGMWSEGVPTFTGANGLRSFAEKWCDDVGETGKDVRFGYGIPRYEAIAEYLQMKALVMV